MKILFMNLLFSIEKSINPIFFTKTIRQGGKPVVKISEQMDIDEFSAILFDMIETSLPKDGNFIQSIFGGKIAN